MSTADFTALTGAEKVSELARALSERSVALRSNESASSFPSNPHAGQWAYRTDLGWVFQRNTADTAWIPMWEVDNGPWAPYRVEIDTGTTTTWVATTELTSLLGSEFVGEGIDLFLYCTLTSASTDLFVKLPDDTDWAYRKILVFYAYGINGGRIWVQNESDTSNVLSITHPGDFALLQVDASGNLLTVQQRLRGVQTVTSNTTVCGATNWHITNWLADATSGNVTFTIPAMGSIAVPQEVPLLFKKLDASANTVTISSTDFIDGAGSYVLTAQHEFVRILPDPDGLTWRVVG